MGLAALLLLFATAGPSLSRMTCMRSGHSTVALGKLADCCPEEEGTGAGFTATCCDFGYASSPVDELLPSGSQEAALLAALPLLTALTETPPRPAHRIGWLETRPPPLDGPERLSRMRIRLI
jgi:hypothetical protein